MRHSMSTALLGSLLLALSATAEADSIYFVHPATFVPASESFDGIQYWITPHGYRDQSTLELACAAGGIRVDAIENRGSDTYDSVSFNGRYEIRSPDGWWSDIPQTGLALKSPWLGGNPDNWWVMRITGSGSFRPCDYIDPERKGPRRCYPTVSFTVDASDWLWVYYAGAGTWPWPWNPSMHCSV
jgi:hypothetical protein